MTAGAGITVGPVTASDADALAALFASNADYTSRVTGRAPEPEDASEALAARPPGVDVSHKFGVGLWQGDELLGFADVIRGWPSREIAHIGLLMISGDHHGDGLGRRLHEAVLELGGSWPEIETLRITIVDTNADVADPFWRAQGYTLTGESSSFLSGDVVSVSRVWVRES
jgi:GNAT superfamily N-acetyltransferase